MSAHKHTSPTPTPKPAAVPVSVPAAVVAPPISPADPVAVPRKLPLFAIALAVAGTLPIGIGVGVTCRAKSLEAIEVAERLAHDKAQVRKVIDPVSWAWRNQQRADDLLRAGDFGLALQHYQSKENADSLRPEAELLWKTALCREALGENEEALTLLDTAATHGSAELRAAALLAQSRIHLCHREFETARATLGRLFRASQELDHSTAVREDAQFLLVIVGLLEDTDVGDTSDMARPISPLHDSMWLIPEMLFAETVAEPLAATEAPADDHKLVTQLLAAASIEQRRQTSEQLVERLLARNPTHRLAGYLKLALGEVAYQRGELAQAANWYRSAADKPGSAKSIVAAFNEGVVRFQLREYRLASNALCRFIDGVPGNALCSQALLLRGRSLIELGDGELAAFDLQRAADLPGADEVRAWAIAFLGLAQLQAGNPERAAQGMFLRRDRVQGDVARLETGFVVSLARLECLKSADSLDRETIFLLRALSKLDPQADWLRTCGRMMIGRAYQRLNLFEQASEAFERTLAADVTEPFAPEMKLALVDCRFALGDHAQAQRWLADVQANHRGLWSVRAGLQMARWELSQRDHAECLAICRELLHSDSERAAVLRLMGEAHELAGHHALAAECFAGVVLRK